jgi:uncharacterized glyoxalase superfamily protein PhnB
MAEMSETTTATSTITLTPYLCCRNAREAVEFYRKAFGAEAGPIAQMPDGRVLHVPLSLRGNTIFLSDEFAEHGALSPLSLGGSPITLHLQVSDCDAVFQRAVEAGCQVRMLLQDMFWGDRYGLVADPFGHQWSIATTVRQVSPEEMHEAIAAMSSRPAGAG